MTEPHGIARDIFVVCNNVEELGGVQRWAHHIGRLLAGRGHRVHLIGIAHAPDPYDHAGDPPYAMTVLHERRPPGPRAGRLGALRRRAMRRRGAATLSALFRAARPGGVVIAAQVWAMEWVARADTAGLPVVGMSHESYAATRDSSRYARVLRHFAGADRFVLLTREDADAWARAGMSNADVLPNPLHVTPADGVAPAGPVVVALGRLAYEKGHDMLLESWARLAGRGRTGTGAARPPGWRLRIHGSGPEEEELRRQAAGLGVAAEFPGPTSDVRGALTAASIYALPSRGEGFPMGVLEAMAYGLPVVAFDCAPGIREMITHEVDGLLVTPGNTAEFADALERLMDDPALRRKLGSAARTSVRRFAADAVVDRWERLFALLHR